MKPGLNKKIGIVSHVLPPSPSGQAMVLHRLLSGIDPEKYCLISSSRFGNEDVYTATEKLSATYHYLNKILQIPVVPVAGLSSFIIGINALWGIYRRARQIEKIAGSEQCRLLISCTGDLYDLPAVYLASRRLGIPFVPYVFDDYAYQWLGFRRNIAKRLEPVLLKNAKTVIVPNEFMQEEYRLRHGVESTVIHNPCPLPELDELENLPKVFDSNWINIVYTGAIYHAHYDAFRNLIAAIQQTGRSDIKLQLFTAQSEVDLKQQGISGSMVEHHPHISHAEVANVLRQADILFLPLAFVSPIPEVIKTSAPGKTGEYLAVGRAILVHAPQDSFVSWYFREHGCGAVADRNDPALLAEELSRLIANQELRKTLGATARIMAEKDFGIEKVRGRFVDCIAHSMEPEHEQ